MKIKIITPINVDPICRTLNSDTLFSTACSKSIDNSIYFVSFKLNYVKSPRNKQNSRKSHIINQIVMFDIIYQIN